MRTRRYRYSYFWQPVIAVIMTVVMVVGTLAAYPVTNAFAGTNNAPAFATNTTTVEVRDAVTNALIPNFKYLINIDNTGTTDQRPDPVTGNPPFECTPSDPSYPDNCFWASMGTPSSAPIYTQGDQADFPGMTIPNGKYLISVRADGYKMDGVHFSMPNEGVVTVLMQPYDLPDATIQAAIFEDISPTNGGADLPAERGLAGFVGHIADYIGEVTTDVYGAPLCGNGTCISKCYVVDNGVDLGTVAPIDTAGRCPSSPTGLTMIGGGAVPTTAVIEGKLKIPNLGPNRYALSVVPPDGTTWIQTTTLEGNHDWDAWIMEGSTGLDTEFVMAGEPFPATIFGFVKPKSPNLGGGGTITGVIDAVKTYVPANGGILGGEQTFGSKVAHPIAEPWFSLVSLDNGDTAIYIAKGDVNGAFTINNVPNGTYSLAYWDEPQNYILNFTTVTVNNDEVVDLGIMPLAGWWTELEGYVFNDTNRNGFKDDGEPGLAGFPVVMRKRENSVMDRGAVLVTTDANGYYYMENVYPMTQYLIVEAYADLFYTTGITYQSDNQNEPTTVLGQGVDVNILPIIGLGGRLDWGVHSYAGLGGTPGIDPPNGGIVGTVSYDTTRNELDPRFSAVEDWQPGIPDLIVNLYSPVKCNTNPGTPCDATNRYELDPAQAGAFAKGKLLNTVVTETWEHPTGCIARDVNGDPLQYPGGQQVLPTDPSKKCLEGPLMGVQFGPMEADGNFGAAVNGNYGFGDACYDGTLDASDPASPLCSGGTFTTLTTGDYLVEVQVPDDALGRPYYQVTREEDINIFNGDNFVPQIPPPACVGSLHTVDLAGSGTDNYGSVTLPNGIVVPASAPTDNPAFADGGGTVYEGMQKPLCDTKLVTVSTGRSVAPTFNFFTEVPLPARFWGLLVDDLNFSSDPKSLLFGEKAGIPFAPVGVYDYTNRLVATAESDYNGRFEVLLPSSNRINCPTPSGVCANNYRFVGNDPGTPNNWNANYKPQFRTISADFEAISGLLVPADLAPTQIGPSLVNGTQFTQAVACKLPETTPQLFAVDKPYVKGSGLINISGEGFGTLAGQVTLDGIVVPTNLWTGTNIVLNVPSSITPGPHQMMIKAANGQSTVNGLTIHVLGASQPPFPATIVLDTFTRSTNSNNQNLGPSWTNDGGTSSIYRITPNSLTGFTNQAQVRDSGNTAWNPNSFGADQEAYFTFTKVVNNFSVSNQGLILKYTGTSPTSNTATLINVQYIRSLNTILVRTKNSGQNILLSSIRGMITNSQIGTPFAAGDRLGARVSGNVVRIYKNNTQIGSDVVIPITGGGSSPWVVNGGRIGLRFTGNSNTNDSRVDNFGGGTVPGSGYSPNVYEVGPGKDYAVIQTALDAAAASNGDDLVVVYPGTGSVRLNPLNAYYENLIISSPVKLQGVGPGGIRADNTTVQGSIIDGSAYGGDTALAEAFRAKAAGMNWVGNQTISEGEIIFMVAPTETTYGSSFKAAIDGFDLRGGDQQGQANIITQGGAIFANSYVRNLQVTNNVIESNSSSYGTIRIGTPDLSPASNFNANLRIANNRIFANSGTNLAGGIGIFAGADGYEIASNDLCGNFSAEYGGGLTVYGYSPNGRIHHNRIYYNQSYDEAGGIMIAGELPANPLTLSPGSGPTDIYSNLIQSNLANDDGGGLRFLMAGNFAMNVYNNMIVNNVSTHEGGGIGINDAPNVRIYNNTIAKNITTATALTSNGYPAPAGISTGANSALMQITHGLPVFSSPILFNNIFQDNRAGTRGFGTVSGLSDGDANVFDLGVADGSGSIVIGPSNLIGANPPLVNAYNTTMLFQAWRTNPNFIGAIMVSMDVSPTLLGNYHLTSAINGCTNSYSGISMPSLDFDSQPRLNPCDIGADEYIP